MQGSEKATALEEAGLTARLDARFRRPLMSYFLRRIHSRTEAEDLTQQVFVRLLATTRTKLEAIDHAEGFVFTVAANLLKDRNRSSAVRYERPMPALDPDLITEIASEAVEDRHPERVLLARESLQGALKTLDALGERTRDIFILHRLENMKHRDIAELFGLSVSSVEKHVIKATVHLARKYGPRQ